jgi:hypothetical protein
MSFGSTLPLSRIHRDEDSLTSRVLPIEFVRSLAEAGPASTLIRVAQTAFILFSTFLELRPVSDASD